MTNTIPNSVRKPLTVWLSICCILILCMAVIGAITRLTESGLSITRWEPIKGTLPPLNDAAWNEAYELYKATPQYAGIHDGMKLDEFKGIYFWEWIHRLWGRLIGIAFALPMLFFALKNMIPKGYMLPLTGIFLLGGLQGFIGWFMVQSGLEPGQVAVSPYRLALHLGVAILIYSLTFWQILKLNADRFVPAKPYTWCMHRHTLFALVFLAVTIIWGAFTAGLGAGKIYNSFPLMDGHLVPPDFNAPNLHAPNLHPMQFWLTNITANPAAVQFIHRVLATITLVLTATLAWRMHGVHKQMSIGLGVVMAVQYALGIITVLSGAQLMPAALHQANAIVALTLVIGSLFLVKQKN